MCHPERSFLGREGAGRVMVRNPAHGIGLTRQKSIRIQDFNRLRRTKLWQSKLCMARSRGRRSSAA